MPTLCHSRSRSDHSCLRISLPKGRVGMRIALLSQEGSVIAFFAMTRGVVPQNEMSQNAFLKGASLEPTPRTSSTAASIVLPS